MRVYIAGAMTGKFDYKKYFMQAESYVRALGHIVVNPAYLPEGLADYFEINKAMIDQCDAVYVLLDHKNSQGTKKEIEYAQENNKQVIYQTEAEAVETPECKKDGWMWVDPIYSYHRHPPYSFGVGYDMLGVDCFKAK